LESLAIPNVGSDVEQMELSCCLKEQYDTITTLENSLAVTYKVKRLPMLYPVIMLLGIYPREVKAYIKKKKCKNVYSSFIHSSQAWKQYKCPSVYP